MTCACGCGADVRAGRTFAKGHNLRNSVISTDQRRRMGREIARKRPRAFYQAAGRKGGRTSKIERWAALLEIWLSKTPREAVHAAYKAGYHAGYQARPDQRVRAARQRNRQGAAA